MTYLSIIHACLQTLLVLPDLLFHPPWNMSVEELISYTSPKVILGHCLFFIYIITDCIKNKLTWEERIHHVLTVGGLIISLYIGPHYIGYLCLTNEVSTIFLHGRHLFKGHAKLYCKFGFLITFTIFRILLNAYLLLWTMRYLGLGVVLILQMLTYGLNLYWYSKILRITYKVITD